MSIEEAVRASERVYSVTFIKLDGAEFEVRLPSYNEDEAKTRARGILAKCAGWATADDEKAMYAEWKNWSIIRVEQV